MSIESVMPSSHLILCCPLLLLPPIPPSIRVFSNESTLRMRWPKYWSFSFSISPSKGHPGLISFRMDWLDLLAVQGTPTPQFKSINSLVFSLLYGPTLISIHDYWKNHSFDYRNLCWQSDTSALKYAVWVCQSFSSKDKAAFNFMSEVTIPSDFKSQENKVCHCFHCFPIYLP